jgi:hypothetical protein
MLIETPPWESRMSPSKFWPRGPGWLHLKPTKRVLNVNQNSPLESLRCLHWKFDLKDHDVFIWNPQKGSRMLIKIPPSKVSDVSIKILTSRARMSPSETHKKGLRCQSKFPPQESRMSPSKFWPRGPGCLHPKPTKRVSDINRNSPLESLGCLHQNFDLEGQDVSIQNPQKRSWV